MTEVGRHSTVALSALIRANSTNKETALMLLADGTRSEAETTATATAAYIAGFDLLLLKPFEILEFSRFAKHILKK